MPLPLRYPLPDGAVPDIHAAAPLCPEAYMWVAVYTDGDWLCETSPDGVNRPFSAIDLDRLGSFLVLPLRDHLPPAAFEPKDGKRLIFFRRRQNTYDGGFSALLDSQTLTVIGWQDTVEGRNVKSFHVIYPDGAVYLTHDSRDF